MSVRERPDAVDRGDDGGSGESPKERVDRELIELLNELRVALPGVQVLFAFLLTVPFSSRFEALTDQQRRVYFVTFLVTTAASVFLMAPTAYHRLRFRQGDKERMLRTSNRFAIVGIALLAVAIGGSVYLVADVMYGVGFAVLVGIVTFAFLVGLWFLIPLRRFLRQ
ncbi:MAG TPA: DUF6328 family protein [Actinomycetota bacterium]|jgi:amino acid transporter